MRDEVLGSVLSPPALACYRQWQRLIKRWRFWCCIKAFLTPHPFNLTLSKGAVWSMSAMLQIGRAAGRRCELCQRFGGRCHFSPPSVSRERSGAGGAGLCRSGLMLCCGCRGEPAGSKLWVKKSWQTWHWITFGLSVFVPLRGHVLEKDKDLF